MLQIMARCIYLKTKHPFTAAFYSNIEHDLLYSWNMQLAGCLPMPRPSARGMLPFPKAGIALLANGSGWEVISVSAKHMSVSVT